MRAFRDFLLAIRFHPRWGWAALLAYAAAVTFPHENVQWVVNEIANRISHKRLYQVSAALLLIEGALFTFVVYKRIVHQPKRRTLAAFWMMTLALIWCAWRFFTANNVELVHYPQYIPEGVALLALTLSPAESLCWIALFGGLDESFQYWHLSPGKPVPYDFNDIYMDLLGGAAGVLLALIFFRCEPRLNRPGFWKRLLARPGIVTIMSLMAAGIALWSTGRMVLYTDANSMHWFALSRIRIPAFWFQVVANGPNKYHTLSPIEGPLLILATIAFYSLLDRRVKISI